MDHAGLLSVLPPLLAILLAIWTRQVFFALGLGVWSGYFIIEKGDFLDSFFATLQGLVNVFADPGNTRTILFCALVGALIVLIQKSGGVEGFVVRIQQLLTRLERSGNTNTRKLVPLFAWLLGVLVFVETSISSLTVGTLFRPLFDKLKISREKLAWIADSSSAPASILIPFNGWGAFIMGLLAAQGFEDPFSSMVKALTWNFYPILTLMMVPAFIWLGVHLKGMGKAERRVQEEDKILPDGAQPMVSEEITAVETKPGLLPRSRNMILPLAVMVFLMPIILAYTGWEEAVSIENNTGGFWDTLFLAIGKGSGSTAVLASVTLSILFAFVLYRVQGFFKLAELMDMTLKGVSGLVPLALLMVLAFAIGAVCKELGTGIFLAEVSREYLSPGLIPAIIFITASLIAFSTGTSWGTFAIMLAIAIPMAREMGTDVYIAIAAALGGGVFGDHCSPISDTTIISSMAAACDHIDHVKTQVPYALLAGFITVCLYLVAGFMA